MDQELQNNISAPIPNAAKLARAERNFSDLLTTGKLTSNGGRYIIMNTDPYHDTPVTGCHGIPNMRGGKSVVCSIVQEMEVSKPTGMAAGNWNARITSNPFTNQQNLVSSKLFGSTIVQSTTGPFTLNAVNFEYALSGTDFSDNYFNAPPGLNLPPAFTKGSWQVVGQAIEVVNTSAELELQGLCTCALLNSMSMEPGSYLIQTPFAPAGMAKKKKRNSIELEEDPAPFVEAGGYSHTAASLVLCATPPINLSEMVLLPETTQWHAKHGAYAVCPVRSNYAINSGMTHYWPIVMATDPVAGAVTTPVPQYGDSSINWGGGELCYTPIVTNTGTGLYDFTEWSKNAAYIGTKTGWNPQDMKVIMFTGLHPNNTLTCRVRWILERFPSDQEPDIVVMTQRHAVFDPLALEIASRAHSMLPPAVKFAENASGSFWKRALGIIGDIAGPLLTMMPHPAAKIFGTAVTAANAAFNDKAGKYELQGSIVKNNKQKRAKRLKKAADDAELEAEIINKAVKKKRKAATRPPRPPPLPPRSTVANGYSRRR